MSIERTAEPNPTDAAVRRNTDGTAEVTRNLTETRERIDALDVQIIQLLAQRSVLVRDAARFKRDATQAPAYGRQALQYLHIREVAEAQQSPLEGFPEFIENTYRKLIPGFVELQIAALAHTELIEGSS